MPPRARMRMDDGPINMPMLAAVVVTTTVVVSLIVSYLVSLGGGPMPTGRTARLQGATGSAVQVVHLPGDQVEMGFVHTRPRRREGPVGARSFGPYGGGSLANERGPVLADFAPGSAAMRQAYRFAEENRPSVTRVFDRRTYGVQMARLRPRRGRDETLRVSRGADPRAAKYQGMIAELKAIHKDQKEQALAGQAEEAQLTGGDPTILANEVMRSEAGTMAAQLHKKRAKAAVKLQARQRAKATALKAARSTVEARILGGHTGEQPGAALQDEAPARLMALAEEPSPAVAPGAGGEIQAAIPPVPSGGNGCAGGLLCSIPTNNVAVQALEARLQADEIAIATLTRDVSELTQQTEELQKPLPQPSGAAKAP